MVAPLIGGMVQGARAVSAYGKTPAGQKTLSSLRRVVSSAVKADRMGEEGRQEKLDMGKDMAVKTVYAATGFDDRDAAKLEGMIGQEYKRDPVGEALSNMGLVDKQIKDPFAEEYLKILSEGNDMQAKGVLMQSENTFFSTQDAIDDPLEYILSLEIPDSPQATQKVAPEKGMSVGISKLK